jgi:hypothetical protein
MLKPLFPVARATVRAALGVGLLASAGGCRKAPAPVEQTAPSAAPARLPADRLAPGELAVGDGDVFGLPVPRGMVVLGRAPDSALLIGEVTPEAVANYVRDRVVVSHVEVAAGRTVFPRARIKDGPADRVFRIDVVQEYRSTKLFVTDVTPPPPPAPGLSDAERWRRAGFSADGRALDPKRLE